MFKGFLLVFQKIKRPLIVFIPAAFLYVRCFGLFFCLPDRFHRVNFQFLNQKFAASIEEV